MANRSKALKSGVVIATCFGLAVVAALALGSRLINESRSSDSKVRTGDVIKIGVIGDFSKGRPAPAAEMLAGIRLWTDRIEQTRGIPYNTTELAAVKMEVANDRGSPENAGRTASALVKRGATVLFGPPNDAELTAVARVALRTRVPLFSSIPRPLEVPRSSLFTFLDRPHVADFAAAFDALDAVTRGRRRGRVLILTVRGEWGLQARRTAQLAQGRAYIPVVIRVGIAGIAAALSAVDRTPFQATLVSAPFQQGLRWFLTARSASGAPWVLAASDVRSSVAASRRARVAVAVPWSPMTDHGGPIFSSGVFTQAYGDAYGSLPTAGAAAGATLGVVLSQAIQVARSTDTSRILAARDRMRMDSVWGRLSFVNGEEVPPAYPFVVLLDRGVPRGIAPNSSGAHALEESIPPRAVSRAP